MHRLRRKLSTFLHRVRRYRGRRYQRRLYDNQRQQYYAASSRKRIADAGKVSIIVPCYNTRSNEFEELLSSVLAQSYGNWELVLADGSTDEAASSYVARKSAADNRVVYLKVENKGIASTTNLALEAATGDFIAFLDHDDTLDPDALAYSVEQFVLHPGTGLVYSDEDKLSIDGKRYAYPHYKPDFSLDMLRNVNYITHFVVARTKLVREIGGIQLAYEGAQDYDFLLRMVDTGAAVRHIPRILYHWRLTAGSTAVDFKNKASITDAGIKALADHYGRNGITGVTVKAIKGKPGFYLPSFTLKPRRRAIVIDVPADVDASVTAFMKARLEANASVDAAKVEILILDGQGADELAGFESVMFIHDIVIPGSRRSPLTQLFALAEEPDVYAVSPKIVSNGQVEDMGLVRDGRNQQLMPLFNGIEGGSDSIFGTPEWVRDVNALSGRVVVLSGENLRHYLKHPFTGPIESPTGRLIVWSHLEMLSLINFNHPVRVHTDKPSYFNENITFNYTPVIRRGISVIELMKESAPAEVDQEAIDD